MDVVHRELTSGNDNTLSQILSEWSKRYEKKYEQLNKQFFGFIGENRHRKNFYERPKSAEINKPTYQELFEQLEDVLKLKTSLIVELESLQEIRNELEDSECMSEVHLRLERTSNENRKLQTALRLSHEQNAELFLSKRILEAEMSELRSSRDSQLAEANERVRMAERAILAAATSRNRTAAAASAAASGGQSTKTESSPTTQLSTGTTKSYTFVSGFRSKAKNINEFKKYATLTAMSFDDFDSLDEGESDDDNDNYTSTEFPSNASHDDLTGVRQEENDSAQRRHELSVEVNDAAANQDNRNNVLQYSGPDSTVIMTPLRVELETPKSKLELSDQSSDLELDVIAPHSPTSSSTPRKSLSNEAGNSVHFSAAILSNISQTTSIWGDDTRRTNASDNADAAPNSNLTVPKAEYLKLLDEIEELRQEVHQMRQHANLMKTSEIGVTAQLEELAEHVQHDSLYSTPESRPSLLPPPAPGSTRFYDWSISLNQSDARTDENDDDALERTSSDTEERTPVANPKFVMAKRMIDDAVNSLTSDDINDELTDASSTKSKTLMCDVGQCTDDLTLDNLCDFGVQVESNVYDIFVSKAVQTADDGLENELVVCKSVLTVFEKLMESATELCNQFKRRLTATDETFNHIGVQELMGIFVDELVLLKSHHSALSSKNVDIDQYQTNANKLLSIMNQLGAEITKRSLVDESGISNSSSWCHTSVSSDNSGTDSDQTISNLKAQLEMAQLLIADKLPVDTKQALLETSQLVASERVQFQAELDRRMLEFEQNHTASLIELESSRRQLLEQLATAESSQQLLRSDLAIAQQKLLAKERFLIEQTEERELEREEFRIELNRMENQLRAVKYQLLTSKIMENTKLESLSHSTDLIKPNTPPWFTKDSPQLKDSDESAWLSNGFRANDDTSIDFHRRRSLSQFVSSTRDDAPAMSHTDGRQSRQSFPIVDTKQGHLYLDRNLSNDDHDDPMDVVRADVNDFDSSVDVGTQIVANVEECGIQTTCTNDHVDSGVQTAMDSLPIDLHGPDDTTQDVTDRHVAKSKQIRTTTTRTVNDELNAALLAASLSRQTTITEESTVVTTLDDNDGEPNWNKRCTEYQLEIEKLKAALGQMKVSSTITEHKYSQTDVDEQIVANVEECGIQTTCANDHVDSGVQTVMDSLPIDLHGYTPMPPDSNTTIDSRLKPDKDQLLTAVYLGSIDASKSVSPHDVDDNKMVGCVGADSIAQLPPSDPNDQSCHDAIVEFDQFLANSSEPVQLDELRQVDMIPTSQLSQLIGQLEASELVVKTLRNEIDGLLNYQNQLQLDYNTIQDMLEQREVELERMMEHMLLLETECQAIKKQSSDRNDTLNERDEDVFYLTEIKKTLEQEIAELKNQLAACSQSISNESVHVQTDALLTKEAEQQCEELHDADDLSATNLPSNSTSHQWNISSSKSDSDLCRLGRPRHKQVSSTPKPELELSALDGLLECMTAKDNSFNDDGSDTVTGVVSDRLNYWVNRVHEESVRVYNLAKTCQPTSDVNPPQSRLTDESNRLAQVSWMWSSNVNGNVEAVGDASFASQSNCFLELIKANLSLKEAFRYISEKFMDKLSDLQPNTIAADLETPLDMFNESSARAVHDLIQCVSDALAGDESVWLSMLESSVKRVSVQFGSNQAEDDPIWTVINRLVNQVTSFMQQENQYRKCIVQAHLVERCSLNAEIKSHLTRTEELIEEVNRQSARMSDSKQLILQQNDNVLGLNNQIKNLNSQLQVATEKVKSQDKELTELRLTSVQLSNQMSDQSSKLCTISSELDTVRQAKQKVDRQLETSNQLIKELKESVENANQSIVQQSMLKESASQKNLNHSNGDCTGPGNISFTVQLKPVDKIDSKLTSYDEELGQEDICNVLHQATMHLSKTRQQVIELEKQVNNLQSTSHNLRLNLTEAEIRLVPSLTQLKRSTFSKSHSTCCDDSIKPSESTSARFAKLKHVCRHLLSQVGDNGRADDSDDDDDAAGGGGDGEENQCGVCNERRIKTELYSNKKFLDSSRRLDQTIDEQNDSPVSVSVERFRNLYARYLRSESYRRALGFQKRYLLLLLGNFQYSVETVVSSLGYPSSYNFQSPLDTGNSYFTVKCIRNPLQRFRTIVRMVQVIFRMKHLVKRWHRIGLYNSFHSNTTGTGLTGMSTTFPTPRNNPIPSHSTPVPSSARTPLRDLGSTQSNLTSSTRMSPNPNAIHPSRRTCSLTKSASKSHYQCPTNSVQYEYSTSSSSRFPVYWPSNNHWSNLNPGNVPTGTTHVTSMPHHNSSPISKIPICYASPVPLVNGSRSFRHDQSQHADLSWRCDENRLSISSCSNCIPSTTTNRKRNSLTTDPSAAIQYGYRSNNLQFHSNPSSSRKCSAPPVSSNSSFRPYPSSLR